MGTILRSEHPEHVEHSRIELEGTVELRTIIAREGSDLAELLRGRGWVVRSGWRGVTDTGDSVWNLRFETPDDIDVTKHEQHA
jgi:hypothetical protein